jgi:hypothetical protein
VVGAVPIGRAGQIGEIVAFSASDASSFINGADIQAYVSRRHASEQANDSALNYECGIKNSRSAILIKYPQFCF